MRANLPVYDLRAPRNLRDALDMLAREPGAVKPFAGGTDLMVVLETGRLSHTQYISLWGLNELRGIEVRPDAVVLGALTTYADIQRDGVLHAEFPLLCRAAAETGGIATQNRGTIGGNIANASPAADTPPALIVYDAELEIASARGTRRRPYDGFHTGYKVMDLAPDEIITRIVLPRARRGWRQTYRKVGTRRAQAISKVCMAAVAETHDGVVGDIRIAFGSVAPIVVRARHAEDAVRGRRIEPAVIQEARGALLADIAPIDDVRSSAAYRSSVAQNLFADFLTSLNGVA